MVSRTPSERSKAKGDLRAAIPTTSRSLYVGAKYCPEADTAGLSWLESPTDRPPEGRPTLKTTSGKARTGLPGDGGPHHWDRFMSGQGYISASIPREVGWERENQRGHWVDSWYAKRATSAAPNHSQIWSTVRRFSIHSPDLSFCLDRKSATSFRTPGT